MQAGAVRERSGAAELWATLLGARAGRVVGAVPALATVAEQPTAAMGVGRVAALALALARAVQGEPPAVGAAGKVVRVMTVLAAAATCAVLMAAPTALEDPTALAAAGKVVRALAAAGKVVEGAAQEDSPAGVTRATMAAMNRALEAEAGLAATEPTASGAVDPSAWISMPA